MASQQSSGGAHGPIYLLLAADHDRLDALLERATAVPGAVDLEAMAAFRAGLLRHIGIEEKVLLPAAKRANGGKPIEQAARLRADHGRFTAMMVPTPTPALVAELRALLGPHNAVEEEAGGVYDLCERLAGDECEAVLEKIRRYPEVPLRPWQDVRTPLLLQDPPPRS